MEGDENVAGSSRQIPLYQQFLNALVANCWVGPLVVIYWASSWELVQTTLIYPDDTYASIWVSAGIGFGVYLIFSCLQKGILDLATVFGVTWSVIVSRVYTYVLAFACVNQWRFIWSAWDVYTSKSLHNALATLLGAYFIMVVFRCSLQVVGPPCVVALDAPITNYFEMTTYFGSKTGTWKHIPDSLLTVTVVPILVVTVWRGLWHVQDHVIFPDDVTRSAIISLVIALALEAVLLLTRSLWIRLSAWTDNSHWLVKYVVEDVHSMLHNVVSISHWRGVWLLFDTHFLEPPLRYWLGHAIAYAMLTLSVCSNSFIARGCLRDCSRTEGQGVNLDMHYVTHAIQLLKPKTVKIDALSFSYKNPLQTSEVEEAKKGNSNPTEIECSQTMISASTNDVTIGVKV